MRIPIGHGVAEHLDLKRFTIHASDASFLAVAADGVAQPIVC